MYIWDVVPAWVVAVAGLVDASQQLFSGGGLPPRFWRGALWGVSIEGAFSCSSPLKFLVFPLSGVHGLTARWQSTTVTSYFFLFPGCMPSHRGDEAPLKFLVFPLSGVHDLTARWRSTTVISCFSSFRGACPHTVVTKHLDSRDG